MGGMSTDRKNTKLNELLDAAAEIARSENRSAEDVLKDALDHYRRSRQLEEITRWGAQHSRKRGLKPSDVAREIDKDHAQQNRGR
jgi:hypothetical protein